MLRSLWTKALRDRRLAVVGWGLGLGAMAYLVLLLYPAVARTAGLNEYVESLPPVFTAILGEHDLLSPAGFVNAELFHFLIPFVMISCAVGVGADQIAGALERRTLELVLANPISRGRLALEGYLAVAGVVFSMAACVWIGLVFAVRHTGVPLGLPELLGATFSAALLALLFGTLALFLGCLASRKGAVVAIAASAVTGSFLLHTVGGLVEPLESWRALSPFYLYQLGDPVRNGLSLRGTATLALASLALLGLSAAVLRRRDLA